MTRREDGGMPVKQRQGTEVIVLKVGMSHRRLCVVGVVGAEWLLRLVQASLGTTGLVVYLPRQ